MASLELFIRMGGYSAFVWPAYAVAALILFFLGIKAYYQFRKTLKQLKRQHAHSS